MEMSKCPHHVIPPSVFQGDGGRRGEEGARSANVPLSGLVSLGQRATPDLLGTYLILYYGPRHTNNLPG